MNSSISVAIAEGDSAIRQSLAILIDGAEGFRCRATYPTAEEALNELSIWPADVVLMDVDWPGIRGFEWICQLKLICPATRLIISTIDDSTQVVFEALQAGADRYILKHGPLDKLLEAIADLHQGESLMSSTVARKIVILFQYYASVLNEVDVLTPCERNILDRLAEGYCHQKTAVELFISPTIVRKHIFTIYKKLHRYSKAEAVNKYLGRW